MTLTHSFHMRSLQPCTKPKMAFILMNSLTFLSSRATSCLPVLRPCEAARPPGAPLCTSCGPAVARSLPSPLSHPPPYVRSFAVTFGAKRGLKSAVSGRQSSEEDRGTKEKREDAMLGEYIFLFLLRYCRSSLKSFTSETDVMLISSLTPRLAQNL